MTSTDNLIESMRVHRRFTLSAGSGLLGDPSGMWTTYRYLEERVVAERAACAELVRAMAEVERKVGETWEKEAREQAPGADAQHLRNCKAIGYAHQQFADRLEDLAAAIEGRT